MAHTCGGNCANCGGCAKELVLTQREIDLLETLSQIPFLPVARKMGDLTPVCMEPGMEDSRVLELLEKKALISLDYHMPIRGFDQEKYAGYPIVGSMALTERGQKVLELLEVQGAEEI